MADNPFAQFVPAGGDLAPNPFAQFAAPTAQPATPRKLEDEELYAQEITKAKANFDQVRVPAPEGVGSPASPEQAATEGVARQRALEAEDATRTPRVRAVDTAAFIGSLPIRMATRGEYGLGDVAEKVGERSEFANALRRHESGFVQNNSRGLEAAAAAGDVMAGVPMLRSMGAVPGQMLRTSAAALPELPRTVGRVLREESGAGPIAGSPPLPPARAPPGAVPRATLAPTKAETIAAGERIGVPIMRAVVGNEVEKGLAGGLSAIPYAGSPLVNAFKKGVQKLGDAAARTTAELGNSAGPEIAGGAARQGILDWIGGGSKKIVSDLYDSVDANIADKAATRPLSATAATAKTLAAEQRVSATTHNAKAIGIVEDALARPEGLTYDGVKGLRTVLGNYLDGSVLPEPGTSMPAIKRLYGALTEDLRGTIKQAGGPKALGAWEKANTAANVISGKREQLAKIVGIKGDVPAEMVVKRFSQMASGNAGDIGKLRLAKQTLGKDTWGDVAATIASHYGMDPSTDLFSGSRFLTAYGKLSDAGKSSLFGSSKQAFDDIALVASKFRDLERLGNPSGTGRVNAVMKIITHPTSVVAGMIGGALNPVAGAATILPGMAALRGGRSLAWYLSKPQVAGKAGGLVKAYYGVEAAFAKGAGIVAAKEEALDKALRSFSLSVARETGGNVKAVEADIAGKIKDIRSGGKGESASTGRVLSHDEVEAVIVDLVKGQPGLRFDIPSLRKKFPDVSDAEFNKALDEMAQRGVIELPVKN